MTDINTLVDDATAKGSFSVLDAARGRSYPQDTVSVYTDEEAAYEVHRLNQVDADEKDSAAHESRVAEIDALKERVKASVLTFRMRGVSDKVKDSINKETIAKFGEAVISDTGQWISGGADFGDGADWNNAKLLAEHILDVTDAEGNVDSHHWTPEEIIDLRTNVLPEDQFQELVGMLFKLSFAKNWFDASVTPDFS